MTNSGLADAPTVAGSHMTQPRQSTPGNINPRVRSADDRPGDVSDFLDVAVQLEADPYSVARHAVRTTTQPTSCYATAATTDITDIASIRQFEQFPRMIGTVHGVL